MLIRGNSRLGIEGKHSSQEMGADSQEVTSYDTTVPSTKRFLTLFFKAVVYHLVLFHVYNGRCVSEAAEALRRLISIHASHLGPISAVESRPSVSLILGPIFLRAKEVNLLCAASGGTLLGYIYKLMHSIEQNCSPKRKWSWEVSKLLRSGGTPRGDRHANAGQGSWNAL